MEILRQKEKGKGKGPYICDFGEWVCAIKAYLGRRPLLFSKKRYLS